VLFCDLVGFTPLSESRDPEEVRELLSGYFDLARAIVGRYGGVIQKFIGDAVMALWGAPVANEDDAERAVRAGLELVSAVSAYGNESGIDLEARVGVVTGQAATTETPEEGLVVGDRVNTAARIQAVAGPATCLVDEATKHATDAAIVYRDRGTHGLKGKAEPAQLYEALRVVAGVGGALKSEGLEAPFVGRDRELRLVKDLFHASAEEQRAHLVSVTGIAGIGKSRLAWEFYKYMDGLSDLFRWHRGRCLSYGEGVAYWALAEMVRGRAGILEGEDGASALTKLHLAVEAHVSDDEERQWVEPRLAHLVGLEDRIARDKEDLFAAWRLFFERMAETVPVVMSFEDTQWADASLLDFIEYLLDWSRNYPIFVLTLARPELVDRRPSWGAGRRNFTSIYLEPLSEKPMRELVTGLVPGLPEEVSEQILVRAEGVPLYAVETVRMLIDRGLLIQEGSSYQPVGVIGALDIPETLQALISARLDGLSIEERSLLQDAAVIGKTFSKESLVSLTRLPVETLQTLLASLVRKEVITMQSDPRSPERGQYGFLQDLVRAVAYETLPKRQRKDKHLAVAGYLANEWGDEEQEIIEVVASHCLRAYELAPEAEDAPAVKARARQMLVRAGERAAALAASEEARRYFEQALELADDPDTDADLEERAGQMAWRSGRSEPARSHFERAMAILDAAGRTHDSARVTARLGDVDYLEGRLDEAVERMEAAFTVLATDETDADVSALAAQLGRMYYFMGKPELAAARIEFALALAEKLDLPEQLSQGLNTKGMLLSVRGRKQESVALLRHALQVALSNGLSAAALRAYNNLVTFLEYEDKYDEALEVGVTALELARRTGDKTYEGALLGTVLVPLYFTGRWDELLERVAEIQHLSERGSLAFEILIAAAVHAHQGDVDRARDLLDAASTQRESSDLQVRSFYLALLAIVLQAEGLPGEALAAAENAIQTSLPTGYVGNKLALVGAFEAALDLADDEKARELLERLDRLSRGETTPFLVAQTIRQRARLASRRNDEGADAGFLEASTRFRRLGALFWLAVTLVEHGEWLAGQGRFDEAERLAGEAITICERLGAGPMLERARAILKSDAVASVGKVESLSAG
jgi:class 3 adenylate cyclase/tetratricopeptide (TPR) repeat protein